MARTTTRFGSRLDVVLFCICAILAFLATILPANLHQSVASSLRRSVVAPLVGLQQGAERWRAAWVSSNQRATARDSLALRAASATALQTENDRLRRLLGLGTRLQWGFVVAEALQGGGSADPFTVVLTAGSNAGVQPGSPVVAPEGLVGTVQTVDPTISLAIIYPHSEFRASAKSADDSVFGIVASHLTGGVADARAGKVVVPDRYLLELRGVPYRRTIKPGTLIVTSGLGGLYPAGIPIGHVVAEIKTPEVWARTYLLRPVVNPAQISSVMVLMAPKVKAGTGAVWEAPASLDSATKGVVAAGDSLGRAAAVAEAARRAALDSAVRASRPVDSLRPDSLRADSAARARAAAGLPPAAPTTPAARPPATGAAPATPTPRRDTVRPRPDSAVRPRPR